MNLWGLCAWNNVVELLFLFTEWWFCDGFVIGECLVGSGVYICTCLLVLVVAW